MLRILGALLLLIALAGGVLAYQVLGAAPQKAPVAPSPDAAASFDQKADAVRDVIATGGKKPVQMVLTEQELSSKLQETVGSSRAGEVREVVVKLGEGVVTVSAVTNLGGRDLPVEAQGRLGVSGGLLSVDLTSVKAGNLDLPAPLRSQLIEQVKQAAGLDNLQKIDLGIDVRSVRVANGQLQIEGQTR